MLESGVQIKAKALLDFCSKKGFGLLLTDGKQTIYKIKKTRYNYKLERLLLKEIENNALRKNQYTEITQNCPHTQNELLKVVLKHNLKYKSYPFKLQHGTKNEVFRQVFIEKETIQRFRY